MSASHPQRRRAAARHLHPLDPHSRQAGRALLAPIVRLALALHITANMVTVIGLLHRHRRRRPGRHPATCSIGAVLLAVGSRPRRGRRGAGAGHGRRARAFGGFLDSTLDRAAEAILYVGVGAYFLRCRAPTRSIPVLARAMVALAGSFLVSYARARAEGIGLSAEVGLAPRTERLVLIVRRHRPRRASASSSGLHRRHRDHRAPGGRATVDPAHLARLAPEPGDRNHTTRRVEHRGSNNGKTGNGKPRATGIAPRTARSGSRSWGSATAPRAWCRAATTTRTPKDDRLRPRPDARQPGRLPHPRHRVRGRLRRRQERRSARTSRRRSGPGQNNTFKFADVPHLGVPVERGMTHDGLGKYLSEVIEKAPGPTADMVGILKERKVDVMVSYLPVGSEEATKWYVEQALQAGVGVRQRHPGLHRSRALLAAPLRRGGPADHRRRHQEPGRRDHHPPRADPPLHGPRRADRPHLPAELRRQHRLPEHARARASRVEEDQQDERGDLACSTTRSTTTTSTSGRPTTSRG